MFILDPADESFLEVIGSNTSMVASFSSTTNNAFVRIYANDPNSNVGYVVGSSNVSDTTPMFLIGEVAADGSNVLPSLTMVSGNIGIGTIQPAAQLHVNSAIRLDSLTTSKVLVSDAQRQITSSSVSTTELGYLAGTTSSIQSQINAKQATIQGAASTITDSNLSALRILVSDMNGKVAVGDASSNEVSFLVGVSSPIQTQLNSKQQNINGAASTITSSNLSSSKVLISDANGKVATGDASSNELSYLVGVTGPIQNQINGKLSLTGGTITGNLTVTDTLTTSNLTILSSTSIIDASTTYTSNITIDNTNGVGPALFVGQKTVLGSGTIAEFYDYDVSYSVPVLKIADQGNIGIGTATPLHALHVEGGIFSSTLQGDRALITDAGKKLVSSSVTATELSYVSGVTASIQTQLDGKEATIAGAASSVTSSNLSPNKILISNGSGKIAVGDATSNEVSYLVGVTSPLQTQLNAKEPTITGAATTITSSDLGANRILISNGSGKVAVGDATSNEVSYLVGVSSPIQTQINSKQPTITGAATTITSSNLSTNRILISDGTGKVIVGDASSNEVSYLVGVTSPLQSQLNNKLSLQGGSVSGNVSINGTLTTSNLNVLGSTAIIEAYTSYTSNILVENLLGAGAALVVKQKTVAGNGNIAEFYDTDVSSTSPVFLIGDTGCVGIGTDVPLEKLHVQGNIRSSSLSTDRVLISDGSKNVATSSVTTTELSYLSGTTSNVQTQLDSKQPTITGAATTIASSNLASNRIVIVNGNGKIAVGDATSNEVSFLVGVTSNIQTQLDSKQVTITGAATTITSTNLSTNKILISDASGKVATGDATSNEVSFLVGVTSSIQTQLDSKQATITGAATTIATSNLTSSRILISDTNGKVAVGDASSNEVSYLVGVTSPLQQQINSKLNLSGGTIAGSLSVSGTISASNLNVVGDTTLINTYTSYTSNILVENLNGSGPALVVKQKTILGSGNIAEFYDTDIGSGIPVFLIGDTGSIGIGTSSPSQKLHVEGSIMSSALTANRVLVGNGSKVVSSSDVTTTELGYLSGVTSAVQTQLDSKQSNITGAASTITSSNLATNLVLISNGSGKVSASSVTTTELGYLSGVTSGIQTQLSNKLSLSGGTLTSNLNTSNIAVTTSGETAGLTVTHTNGPAVTFYNTDVSSTIPSLTVSSTGNVGIGTGTANYKLHVEGNIYANQIAFASDATLKTNVKTLDNALSKVEALRGVSYERIDTYEKQIGVIAQEVRQIIPEVVGESPQGLSVAYGNMVAILIEAVKELSGEVKKLRDEFILSQL